MGLFSSIFGKKPGAMEAEAAEPEVPESNEELSEALGSSDGASRVDAARTLLERWRAGDAQAAEAIAPRLDELLDDPEPLVRIAALGGVRLLRKPENIAHAVAIGVGLIRIGDVRAVVGHVSDPITIGVGTAATGR